MIKPASNLAARLKPDRVTTTPEDAILKDRLAIVSRLRAMVQETWPDYPDRNPNNPVASILFAFAAKLEKEIREIG